MYNCGLVGAQCVTAAHNAVGQVVDAQPCRVGERGSCLFQPALAVSASRRWFYLTVATGLTLQSPKR